MKTCCVCGGSNGTGKAELRPYGPGGADICHGCAFAGPEMRKSTEKQFKALLDGAGANPVLGDEDGPQPITELPRLVRKHGRRQ